MLDEGRLKAAGAALQSSFTKASAEREKRRAPEYAPSKVWRASLRAVATERRQ
jgi:hypothetical protein